MKRTMILLMCLTLILPQYATAISEREFGSLVVAVCDDIYSNQPAVMNLGSEFAVAVLKDGALWGWGTNSYGEIGNGKGFKDYYNQKTNRWVSPLVDTPYRILDDVQKVNATDHWAIKQDGSLWVWSGTAVALGLAKDAQTATPQKYMENVRDFSISLSKEEEYVIYIVKEDGTLWGMGKNSYGELGDGTTQEKTTPTYLMSDVSSVYYVKAHLGATPHISPGCTFIIKEDHSLWTWGGDIEKILFDERLGSFISRPVKVLENVKSIANYDYSIIALTNNGTLYAWGVLPASVKGARRFKTGLVTNAGNGGLFYKYYVMEPYRVADHVQEAHVDERTIAYLTTNGDAYLWSDFFTYEDTDEFFPQKWAENVISMDTFSGSFYYCKDDGGLWMQDPRVDSAQKILDGVAAVYGLPMNLFVVKQDGTLWGQGTDKYHCLMGKGTVAFSDKFYKLMDGLKLPSKLEQSSESVPMPPAPISGKPVVQLAKQNLRVNGAEKDAEIYNIDGSNYFKLRDIAMLLNGTASQFSVDYDAARNAVVVRTGAVYTPVGSELVIGTDKSASAVKSTQSIVIDGEKAEIKAFNIGGGNFFKLRDLGAMLGFGVDFDQSTATINISSSPKKQDSLTAGEGNKTAVVKSDNLQIGDISCDYISGIGEHGQRYKDNPDYRGYIDLKYTVNGPSSINAALPVANKRSEWSDDQIGFTAGRMLEELKKNSSGSVASKAPPIKQGAYIPIFASDVGPDGMLYELIVGHDQLFGLVGTAVIQIDLISSGIAEFVSLENIGG